MIYHSYMDTMTPYSNKNIVLNILFKFSSYLILEWLVEWSWHVAISAIFFHRWKLIHIKSNGSQEFKGWIHGNKIRRKLGGKRLLQCHQDLYNPMKPEALFSLEAEGDNVWFPLRIQLWCDHRFSCTEKIWTRLDDVPAVVTYRLNVLLKTKQH